MQVSQHREYPSVIIGRLWQPQRAENALDVLLDSVLGDEQLLRDRLVGSPFSHQREHLSLAIGQVLESVVTTPWSSYQLLDDGRVKRRADREWWLGA